MAQPRGGLFVADCAHLRHGRELGLPANFQELDLYSVFDRRAGIDYRVAHVNVYVER